MLRLIGKRLGLGVVILWMVTLIIFVATQMLPGDAAQAILGKQAADPVRLAALRDQLGLDAPPVTQYWHWLTGLVQLDFGTSLSTREPVSALIGPLIVNSLVLMALSAAVATPLALVIGAW